MKDERLPGKARSGVLWKIEVCSPAPRDDGNVQIPELDLYQRIDGWDRGKGLTKRKTTDKRGESNDADQ
jgi:hypothetical protein